jgi:hypothetical protein
MEEIKLNMPHYPMLRLVVRHGDWLAGLGAVTCAVLAVVAFWNHGLVAILVSALGVGGFFFLIARTGVEMVRLVTDMLLPK